MKKQGILNSDISRILSYLRHTDLICVADCGLPCPDSIEVIDISLTLGSPSFMDVLGIILQDLKVEKYFLANEIQKNNSLILLETKEILPQVPFEFIPHEILKEKLSTCKAVIRTGENSPFANIILQSAVIF